MSLAPLLTRLAHEGVPVGAMARATRTPSDEIWPVLRAAFDRGEITALPRADWPPGAGRDVRTPTAAPARLEDIGTYLAPLQRVFGLTRQEARLVAALLVRREMSSEALRAVMGGTEHPKALHVVMHHLRPKIAPIAIETVTGFGYALPRAAAEAIGAALARHRAAEGLA